MVSLQNIVVHKRGRGVLGPLSLDLAAQGITCVIGPNGAGKTTFLRVLHGVERVTSGTVRWAGDTPRQAYVFQTPIMLRRSVRANLSYPLDLAGIKKMEVKSRVENWAARIGLSNALERAAPRLSGGEKQKLALARALILRPRVLFLDEPCANLDAASTREIEAMLLKARDKGTRIIMATHDMGQARRLASDVVFLLKGCVHEAAAAPETWDAARTPELTAFLKGDIVE